MALAKVLARGQITIPREVRDVINLEPGDTVRVQVVAPDTIQVKVLPKLRLKDLLDRYHIDEPVDINSFRAEWHSQAADRVIAEVEKESRE